jgi:hypothetical protein
MRIWDAVKIDKAICTLLKSDNEIDPIEWLSDPVNIVLENEHGDLALFEYGFPTRKLYSGHYFFKSRGRQALNAARDFLDEIFNSCYNISIVLGLTPVEHKAARWMSRQVGFKSHGVEELHNKEYELFILTKKEFNNE